MRLALNAPLHSDLEELLLFNRLCIASVLLFNGSNVGAMRVGVGLQLFFYMIHFFEEFS